MKTAISLLLIAILLSACGVEVLEDSQMLGYDKGKQTMVNKKKIYRHDLPNGERGYKIETTNHFAIGKKVSLKMENTAILHPNFTLFEATAREDKNKKITLRTVRRRQNKITIETTPPKGEKSTKTIDWEGDLFINTHPMLYSRDLTNPGDSKVYPILLSSEGRVDRYKVTFVGPAGFTEKGQTYDSLHYQIHPLATPKEVDDYFIDPKDKSVLKIQFGYIKFLKR